MRRVFLPAALTFLGWVQRGCAPLARGVAYTPSPSPSSSSSGVQRVLLVFSGQKSGLLLVCFASVGHTRCIAWCFFFAHWDWAGFAFALLRLHLAPCGLLPLLCIASTCFCQSHPPQLDGMRKSRPVWTFFLGGGGGIRGLQSMENPRGRSGTYWRDRLAVSVE